MNMFIFVVGELLNENLYTSLSLSPISSEYTVTCAFFCTIVRLFEIKNV